MMNNLSDIAVALNNVASAIRSTADTKFDPTNVAVELAFAFAEPGESPEEVARKALKTTELLFAGVKERKWISGA
jgi:hypothetical protein